MTDTRRTERGAIEATLARFVTDELGWDGDPELLIGAEALRLSAVLDSHDLIETAGFAETEFGIEIDDSEITQENFGSLDALAALIDGKLVLGRSAAVD